MRNLCVLYIILATLSLSVSCGAKAQEADIIIENYLLHEQQERGGWVEFVKKQAGSDEGKTIITAVATYYGVDPEITALALEASLPTNGYQQDTRPAIHAPKGYTICEAHPSSDEIGAGQHGIETHAGTTFDATIVRGKAKGREWNGINMYLVVPQSMTQDPRVFAPFTVTYLRNDWEDAQRYLQDNKFCMAHCEMAWHAANNNTRLRIVRGTKPDNTCKPVKF
jgi:hypothetical protein